MSLELTPFDVIAFARHQGVTALDLPPEPGHPCSVLLASILDINAPGVQQALVTTMLRDATILPTYDQGARLSQFNAVLLAKVDMEVLVPRERHPLYLASRFYHLGARFDVVTIPGELLLGSNCR